MLGTVILVGGGAIATLVGVVYSGLKEQISDVKADVRQLQGSYQMAASSGARVEDLLKKAPDLDKTILEMNKKLTHVDDLTTTMSKDLATVSSNLSQLQERVNRIDQNLQRAPWILK